MIDLTFDHSISKRFAFFVIITYLKYNNIHIIHFTLCIISIILKYIFSKKNKRLAMIIIFSILKLLWLNIIKKKNNLFKIYASYIVSSFALSSSFACSSLSLFLLTHPPPFPFPYSCPLFSEKSSSFDQYFFLLSLFFQCF